MLNLGDISDILGIVGTGVSVSIWLKIEREKKFNEQRIKIQLKTPKMLIELPGEIERKNLTRSELQGLLGILPMKKEGHRYQLSFLNTADFFVNLKEAQDDKNRTFIEIICAEDELQQFELDKINLQCKVTVIS